MPSINSCPIKSKILRLLKKPTHGNIIETKKVYIKLYPLKDVKGDSKPNDKKVLSERALLIMDFDTSIIKIG